MADERLDDAIDAVVRAVDRIERATRRQAALEAQAAIDDAVVAAEVSDAADVEADEAGLDEHEDLRVPASNVAPGRDAWQPVIGGAGDGRDLPRRKSKAKKKHKEHGADEAELHELVGRIVTRTQELEEHLEAARALRSEITELVARLAAAAAHQR